MGVSHWFDIACTNNGTNGSLTKTKLDCADTQTHKQSNELVSTIDKPKHNTKVPSRVLFVNTRSAGRPRLF